MRNITFFQALCGDSALKNAAIVTTMWTTIPSEVGERREMELKTGNKFFKHALDNGARLLRHLDTQQSAQEIIRAILEYPPQPLLIQQEVVDQRKHLSSTAAGIALLDELAREEQNHRLQLEQISREIDAAIEEHDREAQEELMRSQTMASLQQEAVRREMTLLSLSSTIRPSFWDRLRMQIREAIHRVLSKFPKGCRREQKRYT